MQNAPNYGRVKSCAAELLKKFGYVAPPVDPATIARREGIEVNFVRFGGKFVDVSGFYDPEENAIYVNQEESPLRQTFTIAHELGHALLHREWARSANYSILWRKDGLNDRSDFHEKEANAFAAHLLVPRHFLDEYAGGLTETDLSRLFAVSVPVIRNRLEFEYGL